MTYIDALNMLEKNNYYVFSYMDIFSFFPRENKENIKKLVYRWKKKGWIHALKKGLYELSYPKDYGIPDLFVANRLYSPSYVSLETALSNFSIIPEVAMAVTSVTTKPTRSFKNLHGLFTYRTIKPQAFTGYYVEKSGKYDIFMAEPEKAFIDYYYFKKYGRENLDLDEERFDRDIVSKFNKKKLAEYAKVFNIDKKEIYAYL